MFIISKTLFIVFFIFLFWFYFFSSFIFYFNSSLCNFVLVIDEFSFFLSFMTFFVIFVSFIFSYIWLRNFLIIILSSMTFFCIIVFRVNNLFLLYLFYEASIIPIIIIIVKWGSYPERSLSAVILLIYTSIFTFPFVYVLISNYLEINCFVYVLIFNYSNYSLLISIIIFFTFAVKLPIYGLHFWLPMAHVEAPTFGSIILAGVLLKLGGIGLFRFSLFIDFYRIKYILLGYFIVFTVFVTIVCCLQSDFKRLVAYSSVSHIIVIPLLFLSLKFISLKSLLLIMLFHGLSSPIMFIIVGIIYSMASTRQHILVRGIVLISPVITFFLILVFFFTLRAPPFPSFIGELIILLSTFFITKYLFLIFLPYIFLSIVYNLNWLTSLTFSRSTLFNNSRSFLTFSFFVCIFFTLLLSVRFIFFFYIVF